MKDSGIDALGKVPAHWAIRRLAQIGTISKGGGGNKDDEVSAGIPCIRYGDLYTIHNSFIERSRSFVSKERARQYTAIKYGDVLFAGSGETIDEIGKSAVNLMREDACCGGDVILFRPTQPVDVRYLGYAMDCRSAVIQKATMGRGITIMHIYGAQMKYLTIPIPPLAEQASIVRLLDHTVQHIQRYIRARQKLIALLAEQKQAIIHQAITGQIEVRTGRPYSAYMKDFRVGRLGQLPVHWQFLRLKRFCRLAYGDSLSEGNRRSGSVPVFGSNGRVGTHCAANTGAPCIIIGRKGSFGKVNYSRTPVFAIDTTFFVDFRYLSGHIRWLYFVLGWLRLDDVTRDSAVPGLDREEAYRRFVPVPSVSEQAAIVRYLDSATGEIDAATHRLRRQVTLLHEYRKLLIDEVVTGKIDVRNGRSAMRVLE